MGLMAASTTPGGPKKQQLTREQIIALLGSSANLMDEADDLTTYFAGLPTDRGFSEAEIRTGYEDFRAAKTAGEQTRIAETHGLAPAALTAFVQATLGRLILDGEALGDLLAPLGLGWKARAAKESELMTDLIPLLKKMAQGRELSGLEVYE
jgi:type I restriction enzyme R subunit